MAAVSPVVSARKQRAGFVRDLISVSERAVRSICQGSGDDHPGPHHTRFHVRHDRWSAGGLRSEHSGPRLPCLPTARGRVVCCHGYFTGHHGGDRHTERLLRSAGDDSGQPTCAADRTDGGRFCAGDRPDRSGDNNGLHRRSAVRHWSAGDTGFHGHGRDLGPDILWVPLCHRFQDWKRGGGEYQLPAVFPFPVHDVAFRAPGGHDWMAVHRPPTTIRLPTFWQPCVRSFTEAGTRRPCSMA